jgi:alanine-synthesizing transaminase
MFSSRTHWDFRPSPLHELAQNLRDAGEPIIDLTESNPTMCGFRSQPDHLTTPQSLQQSVLYEPDPRGLLFAREAIAEWYDRQQIAVNPSNVILTSGTSEAYSFLLQLLCDAGEGIAVPKPGYPLFDYLCQLSNVHSTSYRLAYDGEWHIDMQSLEEILSARTKALVLVHPNNPTGSFVKKDERMRILSMTKGSALPLVVDEVFSAFPIGQDGRRHESFAGNQETLTFTLNGLSKLAGLPQMKLAWIVVSGPVDQRTDALQRLEVIADTFLSVGTPVQHSLKWLLVNSTQMTAQICRRISQNIKQASSVFSKASPVSLFNCEGGWNAVLRLPATRSDEQWAGDLLVGSKILTYPGHLFEFELKSCIVVSLLPEPDVFAAGIQGIADYVGM